MEHKFKNIHFIGVGGVGMYSLARLSLERGIAVSGSDVRRSALTDDLSFRGARIFYGHSPTNVSDAHLVVYSLAISDDNAELSSARRMKIPTLTRAEFMAKLSERYKHRIAVSGSHGKSTTTAMLSHIFMKAGKDPTVIAGVSVCDGLPTVVGSDEYLIYEACEYRDSFLKLSPTSVSVTNLELDHTDYFADLEAIKRSFLLSVNSAQDFCVLNTDDANLLSILPRAEVPSVTFGAFGSADFSYAITTFGAPALKYTLLHRGKNIGEFSLCVRGTFNVSNAVCAIATAEGYGIPAQASARFLESFVGIERRMQYVGTHRARRVFYDYAHHPTEIAAVINSLRESEGVLTVVFCPHTYTRTRDLWDGFVRSLSLADHLIVTDIFAAREGAIDGISSERLAAECGGVYRSVADAAAYIDSDTYGSIVLMGAGDLEGIKNAILDNNIKCY